MSVYDRVSIPQAHPWFTLPSVIDWARNTYRVTDRQRAFGHQRQVPL